MGASGWSYFVPYQPDIEAALDVLHQQVFESGKYYLAPDYWNDIEDVEAYVDDMKFMYDEEDWQEGRQEQLDLLAKMRALGDKPRTIDDLLIWNGEEGTSSILDIEYVTYQPNERNFGTAYPLQEDLVDLFGTYQPTHELIQQHKDKLWQFIDRGQAIYIVVYKDQKPDEIFFIGVSGD